MAYIGKISIRPNLLLRMLELTLLTGVAILVLQILRIPGNDTDTAFSESLLVKPDSMERQERLQARATPPAVVKALLGPVAGVSKNNTVAEPVRETRLDLVLKGILMQKGTEQRLAVIQHANKQEKVYRVDDRIENARVVAIEARRVVLLHRGVNESLSLKLDRLARHQEEETQERVQVAGDIKLEFKVERQEFQSRLKDLPSLLKTARTEPYSENDQPAGFRIVDVQKDSVFRQLGLKRDDVLRSVNGLDVKSTKDAFWAYRKLRKEDNFQLAILRDGREVTINYSIQ